jgi:hypothetical protein
MAHWPDESVSGSLDPTHQAHSFCKQLRRSQGVPCRAEIMGHIFVSSVLLSDMLFPFVPDSSLVERRSFGLTRWAPCGAGPISFLSAQRFARHSIVVTVQARWIAWARIPVGHHLGAGREVTAVV